jgi:hypothetical protein
MDKQTLQDYLQSLEKERREAEMFLLRVQGGIEAVRNLIEQEENSGSEVATEE